MIRVERDEDTCTVYYNGDEIGWIDFMPRDGAYRACTKNGRLQHFRTIATATEFIVSEMM